MRYKLLWAALAVLLCPMKISAKYIPMDYSYCGYRASEQSIPDVRGVVYVPWVAGDCSARIQRAINYVSSLPLGKDGFRGAVLLGEGTFLLNEPLTISASGVVLRGMDEQKTILLKQGVDRGSLLYIQGRNDLRVIDTLNISSPQVKAGSTSLMVSSIGKLKKGTSIKILRPSTKDWIASVGCNIYGGGIDALGWKPGDIDIQWDRIVTSVKGNEITYDAPTTATIESKWGGGKVLIYQWNGRLDNCGVENLTMQSTIDKTNPKDEDHCWNGVYMDNARDCWARRIHFIHFAGSAVTLQNTVSRVTVEDCLASEPVSEIGGMRRCTFLTRGQQTLIQRCISRNGIHDFAAGYCAPGPNAFVQCEAEETNGYSGSIDSWATGLLFDIVNIDGNRLTYKNLGQSRCGAGWNTANSLFWQCTASEIECYSPSEDGKNSANGCWGQFSGDGEWDNSNEHVQPRSIFYDQLSKRIGASALNGYVLPRSTDASSSPTVEEAQLMAKEALSKPRLTMEMWQDSVPYTASISNKGLKNVDNVKVKENVVKVSNHDYEIATGRLTMDNALLVGDRFETPWWNGRIKDSFLSHAKPHVTRFVPGREGLGLTDHIDSVVDFMKNNHILVFDHNYGLWYDLRRDDHERIRRQDGDVWAPFYELPFSRSGQGTAWDGLSKYDLTRPNAWYWSRLKTFADKAEQNGLLLFHENYFQHNIIEAGAHWVDCPWRTVNNINHTGFPEPVPFTGDKRLFMAEYFYNENDSVRRALHRQYIRQCLNNFADNHNVVQLIGAEFTGPLHFVQFWIDVIAEWEHETGKHPLIALSTTKDVQDAILADPVRSKVVDIIDIRYWHYKTDGLYAPQGGMNMAPRQFMRKFKVGKTTYAEAYHAVNEYRTKYPNKAVTFFAQNYPALGWGIFMAGGSCPTLPITDHAFLIDAAGMETIDTGVSSYQEIGKIGKGCIIYSHSSQTIPVQLLSGKYEIVRIIPASGKMEKVEKALKIQDKYELHTEASETVYWFHRL